MNEQRGPIGDISRMSPEEQERALAWQRGDAIELRIGSRVSYEDMANPRRHGMVCDIETSEWGVFYVIAWDEGRISTSDCRQRGWRVES